MVLGRRPDWRSPQELAYALALCAGYGVKECELFGKRLFTNEEVEYLSKAPDSNRWRNSMERVGVTTTSDALNAFTLFPALRSFEWAERGLLRSAVDE